MRHRGFIGGLACGRPYTGRHRRRVGDPVAGGSRTRAGRDDRDLRPDKTRANPAGTAGRARRGATAATSDEPIGNVATLTGSATVTRNNTPTPLKLQDDIFMDDVLQTSANSTLGITFNDATTFNLTANARITVDSFVYEEGGKQNSASFNVARGTVAFVAAAVAKTGDMKISAPTATLGIRGTTGCRSS